MRGKSLRHLLAEFELMIFVALRRGCFLLLLTIGTPSFASSVSLMRSGDARFSILENVENSGGPPTFGSFTESLGIPRFDPGLGVLSKVTVECILYGEVEVGVSVRG